ncbi:MAG TPA: FtsX-like permease family protein, partial [Saprospiraceae bacterium]|nr:FtsX-like permease family protein [Saprospiraceae bacterium]
IPLQEMDRVDKKFRLKDQLNNLPGVEQVSLCSTPPSSGSISITDFEVDGVEGNHNTQIKLTDQAYLDLFELKFVAGRSFDPVDTANGWIVNERLSKLLAVTPEELIGRNLSMWNRTLPVIGVVSDFHTTSLAREIEPTTLFKDPEGYRNIAIKLKGGQVNQTIKSIESLWSAQYPDFLFSYTFLDDDIAQFYDGARKMSILLVVFSSMAILIGCLGLYGLISFMATQKEKEIGIRKVLGASVDQIMLIFSREFTLLIMIAFVFAGPLAGLVMNKWLENFAYRIPLGWTMFLTGIVTTLVIAFVTVGYRSIRAATTNPVHALRNE